MISPVQSHYHEGSPMSKEEKLRWEEFVEKVGFEPRVRTWMSDWWMLRVAMMTRMGWQVTVDSWRTPAHPANPAALLTFGHSTADETSLDWSTL